MERREVINYTTNKQPVIEIISGRKTYLYFFKEDSVKARKLSNDMHAKNKISCEDRIEFALSNDSNLVFGKYIVAGKDYFEVK